MEASFRTVVYRLGMVKGVLQERPRGVAVAEGAAVPASRRHRGALYILIEVLGGLPDPDFTLARLAQIIQNEYYQASGSVTGGIGQGLRAANDWLFEENLNSPREQRGVAGVSCAVLRDGDLYLGQIGPALAYLARADGARRFPDDSPWLRQAIPGDAERAASPPLGVRRVIEPQFYHATPDVGDVLVMASPALARLLPDQAVAGVIGAGGEAARRQLQVLASGQDMNALIVALAAQEPAPAAREAAVAPILPAEDEAEEVLLAPARSVRRQEAEPARPRRRPVGPSLSRAGAGLLALLRRTLPERGSQPPPRQVTPAPAVARPAAHPAARAVIVLSVLLPLLVIALVLGSRYQYERNQQQKVAEFLRQAEEAHTAAANSPQKEAQVASLRQAIALVDQALAVAPDAPQATELRRQMVTELDAAANVSRLYTLWELADLAAGPAGAAQAARFLPLGLDLFMLDRGADRIYRRQLNPTGDALDPIAGSGVLLQKGDPVGTIAVDELLDMIWMPAGGERKSPGLMFVERYGSLLEWDVSRGITVLPVADSAAWKKPVAAGAYGGNLYLLDPQQNRILKYVPAADGYTNPPLDYLADRSGVDLSGAVDMAIDGHIYVLMADGKILNFLSGQPVPFTITGLDEPLQRPVAICATGEGEAHGSIYVADAGLARVVQLSKQGQFVRQFKAVEGKTQLAGLSGIFVDEAKQRIYIGSGSKVYVAPLVQQVGQ